MGVNFTCDVLIVGGAVVGSAAAYFLTAHPGFGGRVCVVERDPGFAEAATTRSVASIRHQFSTPENIRMSMFGTEFLRGVAQHLAVDGDVPPIHFREAGYLFLASAAGLPVLQANHAVQRAEGADVALLGPDDLQQRFPWLNVADLAGGSLGLSGEGWLDAHALMHGFRRKARQQGAELLHGELVGLERSGSRIVSAQLADGTRVAPRWVINCAGTRAAAVAAMAGIVLPVQPRKRLVFHFRSPETAPRCPLVIDPSGVYFRPEGDGFLCGVAPPEEQDPECTDFEVDWRWWEEILWPTLAERVPGFAAARVASAWAGHYDVNTLDHNVILGPHPEVDNLLFANGFSGHGLQQSPAVGRALAEWVLHGRWQTLDLTALGWARVLAGRPLLELNVV